MVGIVRKLVNVAILLLIANALYQFVPPYLRYQQFKDDVRDVALHSNRAPDATLVNKLLERAEAQNIPIDSGDIQIRHDPSTIYIDVAWVQEIAFAPFYTYAWEFAAHGEAIEVLTNQRGR